MAEAQKAVATFGLPRQVEAHEALIEDIWRTAGAVDWLSEVVANLERDEVVFGLQSHETGTDFKGKVDKKTHGAAVNVWVQIFQWERRHLVEVCKAALAAGVEERQVVVAEKHAAMLASVLRAVISDAELALTPAQQNLARLAAARHLRAVND